MLFAANLSAWTFSGGGVGEPILASHIFELRGFITGARSVLRLPTATYSAIVAGTTTVNAAHLNEMLDQMR